MKSIVSAAASRAALLVVSFLVAPFAVAAPAVAATSSHASPSTMPPALRAAAHIALANDTRAVTTDPPMTRTQTLTSDDGGAGDSFAWSFAFAGNTALIGSPYADIDGNVDQGAVYVFQLSNGVWTQTQKLIADDGAGNSIFGYSIALDGSTAVISASYATIDCNEGQGAAYVFTETGGTWTQVQKLVADDGAAQDEFGIRVALQGTNLLIGASHANIGDQLREGAAYAYAFTDDSWTQTQKLTSSNGDLFNFFGVSIALDGTRALIGAPDIDTNGVEDQGAVYAFEQTDGVWNETQILIADDGGADDNFGYSVALAGDEAIVGAYFATVDGASEAGAAYVFDNVGGTWTQSQKLTASDSNLGWNFGTSVSLDGSTAVIGAPGAGSAYVFQKADDLWTETQHLTSGSSADGFGFLVSLRGTTLLVGAAFSNVGANMAQGKGYFYSDAPNPNPAITIAPLALSFDVATGGTVTNPLTIANIGGAPLDYAFAEAAPRIALTPRNNGHVARTASNAFVSSGYHARPSSPTAKPWAPAGSLSFILDDGSYEDAIGLNGPNGESAALFLNRFSPPPGTGAFTVNAISILWPDNGDNTLLGKQVNLIAYYDADADGDPSNAIRLGDDQFITIANIDAFVDYTVNFSVPGGGDIYLGFENTYALGGSEPVLFPAALDQDSGSQQRSWLAGMSNGDPDVNVLANNDLFGTTDDFGLAGNFLIRGSGVGTGSGADCATPSDVPWLSEAPASGTVDAGSAQNVDVAVDAGALAAGHYFALLCVTTNDPEHPLAQVPVDVTVSVGDVIFASGFDN